VNHGAQRSSGGHSVSELASLPSGNDPAALRQVRGWNWGAFLASWLWAFAHRQPLLGVATLLGLLFWQWIGLACAVYLGVEGSKLAWRSRPFEDVAHFRRVQRRWMLWGILVFAIEIILVLPMEIETFHILFG